MREGLRVSTLATGVDEAAAEDRWSATDRRLAAWEIVAAGTSALIAEWVVYGLAGGGAFALMFPVLTAVAFMLVSHLARGETLRDVGWRLDNFLAAARLLAPVMLACTAALVAAGWYNSTLDFRRWEGGQSILGSPALSLLWGPLQQYALQGFINRRAQLVFGKGGASVLLTALLFALFHLPNPWLMLATFAGGLLWSWVYQRVPNLFAVGISHGLMTWVLVSSIPPAALHNLRVGYKFFV